MISTSDSGGEMQVVAEDADPEEEEEEEVDDASTP